MELALELILELVLEPILEPALELILELALKLILELVLEPILEPALELILELALELILPALLFARLKPSPLLASRFAGLAILLLSILLTRFAHHSTFVQLLNYALKTNLLKNLLKNLLENLDSTFTIQEKKLITRSYRARCEFTAEFLSRGNYSIQRAKRYNLSVRATNY